MRFALEKEAPNTVKLVVSVQSGPTARLSFVQLKPIWDKPLADLCRVCPYTPPIQASQLQGLVRLRPEWLSCKGEGRELSVHLGGGEG